MRRSLLLPALLLAGCAPAGGGDDSASSADADGDGWTVERGDCDDGDASVNPDEAEVWYDGLDQDCDGNDADQDGDGYSADQDCVDTDPESFPGAPEVACDGLDQDCDGLDLVEGGVTGWTDADLDGYGDPASPQEGCFALPEGTVANADDCDDTSADVSPAGVETCDGRDEDCDGTPDDGLDLPTWYPDRDGDGFGDEGSPITACEAPKGAIAQGGDCDDTSADVSPDASESCNGADDDCDGAVDEAGGTPWYSDTDGDGAGDPRAVLVSCVQPGATSAVAGDCDDADPDTTAAEAEADDGLDNDCDGRVDEDFLGAGSLIITELAIYLTDGSTSFDDAQWFEVYNPDPDRTVYLDGLVFSRGYSSPEASFTLPPGSAAVPPGGYAVLCASEAWASDDAASRPLGCDQVWGTPRGDGADGWWSSQSFVFDRQGDGLSVSSDVELDALAWTLNDDHGRWPGPRNTTLSLDPSAYDATLNDRKEHWCRSPEEEGDVWWTHMSDPWYGTPGAENTACD